MTAVEWLVNELNNQKCWADPARIEIIVQQALELEKEQIKYAFNEGWVHGNNCIDKPSKEYYNETYKPNNQ